jgi:hypothetical protein
LAPIAALPVTLHREPRPTWLPEIKDLWQAILDSQVPVQDTDRAMAWIILDTLDKALRAAEPNASLIIGCFAHLSRFGVAHADRARSGVHLFEPDRNEATITAIQNSYKKIKDEETS